MSYVTCIELCEALCARFLICKNRINSSSFKELSRDSNVTIRTIGSARTMPVRLAVVLAALVGAPCTGLLRSWGAASLILPLVLRP